MPYKPKKLVEADAQPVSTAPDPYMMQDRIHELELLLKRTTAQFTADVTELRDANANLRSHIELIAVQPYDRQIAELVAANDVLVSRIANLESTPVQGDVELSILPDALDRRVEILEKKMGEMENCIAI